MLILYKDKMVNYDCPRCGYSTERKSRIKIHIHRKNPCKSYLNDIVLLEYEDVILKGDRYCENTITNLNSPQEKIKKLQEKIDELENEKKVSVPPQFVNNGTINILNITLPHGDSNYDFLTDKDYNHCLNRMIMSVPNLIKRIHFNPKHPENHNIFISNIKNKLAMVYDGKQWNLTNQDRTINKLITDHEYILEEWLENGEDKYPKAMEKFKKYLELKEADGVWGQIKEEIILLLYNNRQLCKRQQQVVSRLKE
jgi:hypothetical protein